MIARRLPALAAFAAAVGVLCAISCGISTEPACTAESAGFGDATPVARRVIFELDHVGECRPRLELISDPGELGRVFRELESEMPAVDFTRERVVLREANHQAGVAWTVSRADVLTLGLQGCEGAPPTGCLLQIYALSTAASRVETHTCKSIPCPSTPTPTSTPLARPPP